MLTSRKAKHRNAVIFALAVLCCGALCARDSAVGATRAPEGYDSADLVCIGQVDRTETIMPEAENLRAGATRRVLLSVGKVLRGDSSLSSRELRVEWITPVLGPVHPPYLTRRGAHYVVGLEQSGNVFQPAGLQYEVTSRTVSLPHEAPLSEKICLVLIATLHDCRENRRLVIGALAGLRMQKASFDSAYYDLLDEYVGLTDHPDPHVRARVLYDRLLLGDRTALQPALKHAAVEPWLEAWMPVLLETFGDDAVTTLCLIADGKYLPAGRGHAIEALRRMAPPDALPTLIRALDYPDPRMQYYAYTGIEKIRTGQLSTTTADFEGRTVDPDNVTIQLSDNDSLTSHSQMLIDEMKQWWETEGKRQFDYVVP